MPQQPVGLDPQLTSFVRSNVMAALFPHAKRRTLGRFEVQRVLGRGAMGLVVEARDPELDRRVAIKVLHGSADPDSQDRLRVEAQSLAKVRHPNIVTVHEVLEDEGRVCLVMELMQGGPLTAWLKDERSIREMAGAFAAAAAGLHAAHNAGLVHRDFKPDNVVMDGAQVKLTDFGLVVPGDTRGVSWQDGDSQSQPTDETVTQAVGRFAGTPAYAAPEQLAGLGVTGAADIYALSVSIFEALFERRPPPDGSTTLPTRTAPQDARVPKALRALVSAGLSLDPKLRPSAAEYSHALTEISDGPRPYSRAALAAGALAIAGVSWAAVASARVDPCAEVGDAAVQLWGADASAAVNAAFSATTVPYAQVASQRVDERMAQFATSWSQVRAEVCEAGQAQRTAGAALSQARTRCLGQQLSEVRGVIQALRTPDALVLERVYDVLEALPSPEACADLDLNEALADPVVAARLAEARLAVNLGRSDHALQLSAELVAQSPPPSINAQAQLVWGLAARDLGDHTQAYSHLRQAWWSGIRSEPSTAARAAIVTAQMLHGSAQEYERAREWAGHARSVLDSRTRQGADMSAMLALVDARIERFDNAELGDEQQLVSIRDDLTLSMGTRAYAAHTLAGRTLADPAHTPENIRKDTKAAVGMANQGYGEGHPRTAPALLNMVVASTTLRDDDTGEHLARLEAVLGLSTTVDPYMYGFVASKKARLAAKSGDHASAVRTLQAGLRRFERVTPLPPAATPLLIGLAASEAFLGQHDKAREHLSRAEFLQFGSHGPDSSDLIFIWAARAELEGEAGATTRALDYATRGAELARRLYPNAETFLGRALFAVALYQVDLGQLSAAAQNAEAIEKHWALESDSRSKLIAELNVLHASLSLAKGNVASARVRLAAFEQDYPALEEARDLDGVTAWLMAMRVHQALGEDDEARAVAETLLKRRDLSVVRREQLDAVLNRP